MGTYTDVCLRLPELEWGHTTSETSASDSRQATETTEQKGTIMEAPFIFIGTYRLREGKAEGFKQYLRSERYFEYIGEHEPRMLAFHGYLNVEGTEVTFVQVHPDASSMELHMQVTREHIGRANEEFLDPAGSSIEVYGQPSDTVMDMTRKFAGSGVPMDVKPQSLGGFTRLQAA